jgi:chromosome segregation ATPase
LDRSTKLLDYRAQRHLRTSQEIEMSLLPFMKNFIGAGGQAAAQGLTATLVKLSPETATAAELKTMEDDLDNAGRLIGRLRTELQTEQHEFDRINGQYTQLMGAAEVLQKQIDDPATNDTKRTSLTASLAGLLDKIEHMAPELEQERHDVEATRTLLADAETAYQKKAKALTTAKGNLDRARHDMQHAAIEEDRSRQRADTAAAVAGLRPQPNGHLNVALNAMQQTAAQARERAAANDLKATALKGATDSGEDPNVKAAIATLNGGTSPKSLSERLAAAREKQG